MTLGRSCRVLFVVALMAAGHCVLLAQGNRPAAEYQSLLNMRFYEADGGFLVDGLELVFPPQGLKRATFVVSRAGGGEVASVPLRVEPFEAFPAFAQLFADGVPGVVRFGQTGDFVAAVKVDGEVVSAMPFSLKEEKGSDPYNPTRRFTREGAWSDLAFLSTRVDDPEAHVTFNWWASLRELPAAARARALCTVHVLMGGVEVATSNSAVVPSADDWQFFKRELVEAKSVGKPTRQYLKRAVLASKDGELSVVLKANGQPFKTYRMQVKGGQIQHLERSRLGYEPRADFIAPRMIDTSDGSSSRYRMLETYWLKRGEK